MSFKITFKKLFDVFIRHNYYLVHAGREFAELSGSEQEEELRRYDIRNHIDVVPTSDTRRTLARHSMLFRMTPAGFLVGAEVNEGDGTSFFPRHTPRSSLRLRFILRARNPHVFNFTNLSLSRMGRVVYYFSNLAGLEGTTYPFLSLRPPVWASGTTYDGGDLARPSGVSRVIYLALENGIHPRPRANVKAWKKLEGRGYVNAGDQVVVYPPVSTFRFPQGLLSEAHLTAVSPEGEEVNVGSTSAPVGSSLVDFSLDLTGLVSGRYRLEINGSDVGGGTYADSQEMYLDSELSGERMLGLIEIFHIPGADLGDYRLFDTENDHQLVQPSYVIDFLSRYTFWRYIFDPPPEPGTDLGALRKVNGSYVTKEAMPLTERYQQVTFDGGRLLPNPAPFAIKPEEDRVFSDIFV